jgi:hypothetical protein
MLTSFIALQPMNQGFIQMYFKKQQKNGPKKKNQI